MGMPSDFPAEIVSEPRFRDIDGRTELTAIERDWRNPVERERSDAGLAQCLDKLEQLLASRR